MGHLANLEHIRQSLLSRDHRDLDRADGPLICPVDAARIDTTEMTLDQVVNLLESKVQQVVSQC
jgi:cytidylate kinase